MKKHYLIVILFVVTSALFAQSPVPKGTVQLNAGLGLLSWGIPIYVGLDFGVHKDITLGGELSFRSYNDEWPDSHYKHSILGISGNGNYHFNTLFNIPSNWDFYAGLNIGFYFWKSPDDYPGSESSSLGLGFQVGGRYYFTDRFGVNLEIGTGNEFSEGKFGISYKF